MTFGDLRPPGEEPKKRVWSGDREYRRCRAGEEIRIALKFGYGGEQINAVTLVWVLEDAEDRIEMREFLQAGRPGSGPTEMNMGFTGLIPERVIPGRYNLESMRVHYADRRYTPLEFEPPKVGLIITEERVERPQLRGFDFEN